MDLNKAHIILEKINTLYKNISIDNKVSSIERDLMLSYIRTLYETFLETGNDPFPITKPSQKTTRVVPEPVVEEVVVAPSRPKARVVEIPDSIKEYATPPPPPAPKTAPIVVQEVIEPTPAPEPSPDPIVMDEEHAALFEQKEAKELSDRLSQMPIHDLKKSMGLNEKILTINELFGGDHKAFDRALTDLNTLATFEEAKQYMSENLAAKYDWSDKSKKKKAQIFIKLVRRKYT